MSYTSAVRGSQCRTKNSREKKCDRTPIFLVSDEGEIEIEHSVWRAEMGDSVRYFGHCLKHFVNASVQEKLSPFCVLFKVAYFHL